MSEEEKEAVEMLNSYINAIDTFGTIDTKCCNNLYKPTKTVLNYIDKLQKDNYKLDRENQALYEANNCNDKEMLIIQYEMLKGNSIDKQLIRNKIKEYEDMLKTLNNKSDTDRIKAINERIIGYKELLGE